MAAPARIQKELDSDRDPWTKQTWESWKAFDAFVRYRDLAPDERTIVRLARSIAEATGRNPVSVEKGLKDWSVRYRWQTRVDAYTVHMDGLRVQSREERQRHIDEDDFALADQVLDLVKNTVGVLHDADGAIPLEMADRWMEKAVKMRRVAAGLATDNVKAGLVITSADLTRILNRVIDVACDGFVAPEQQEEFIRRLVEEAT